MSDLISRSEVLRAIDENGYVNCKDQKDFSSNCRMDKIRQNVVEMSTVFDLDKVIAGLKELKTYKLDLADTMTEIMARGKSGTYICLEDVIELLKNNFSDTAEPPKTD